MSAQDGGPAFPAQHLEPWGGGDMNLVTDRGMTLRDYFAATALQGLLANPKLSEVILKQGGARSGWVEASAYGFADAMLTERAK